MPSKLPEGESAPADGRLPADSIERSNARFAAGEDAWSIYLHVPFCRVRCGYCDFNTYTATELRGTSQAEYHDEASAEVRFAGRALRDSGWTPRPATTVFFGGGTPTLLPARDLARMLHAVRDEFGLAEGAEVTTEANPDSVTPESLGELARAGFTRVSFGVQSAVPHVLRVLDRTHDPRRVPDVVKWASDAGLDVSVDLIYGTPGESLDDWRASLDLALSLDVGHLSAYALIIEEGTKLARQIRRGEVPEVDPDLQADAYELLDAALSGAGYEWYEISNFARTPAERSRHNLAYWRGTDWWGIGPGSHSHIGGTRFWNVKHPAAYAQRMHEGLSPVHSRERVDARDRLVERVLLESRISEGLDLSILPANARRVVPQLIADGLIEGERAIRGRLRLTLRGRLMADTVVRELTAEFA